jgi:hypothetical protein
MSIEDLERLEKVKAKELRKHLLAIRPDEVNDDYFFAVLLQREWVSYFFTPIYDAILNRIDSSHSSAVSTIRRIIREEYPDSCAFPCGDMPSHREDMKVDILGIGVDLENYMNSDPSPETEACLLELIRAINELKRLEYRDVALLSFLRFWGEVLTAVEYREFQARIVKKLGQKISVFYIPHIGHDEKSIEISEAETTGSKNSHSDELAAALVEMMPSNRNAKSKALRDASYAIELATRCKINFYKQFLHQI